MEAFALYLLRSVIWLSGFALVYILFLRNERYFNLNRFYLISGILASFILPFISIHYTVTIPVLDSVNTGSVIVSGTEEIGSGIIPGLKMLLLLLYFSGSLFGLFLVLKQGSSILRIIKQSEIFLYNSLKLIRSSTYANSFSFFSYVFVNPSVTDNEVKEIVYHEEAHINQKHWIDLVLLEVLCILQWFNPIVWVYARFVRQNHEYLADEIALQRTSKPAIYKAVLLNQIVGAPVIRLANSFSYSLNKKRFTMMKSIINSPYRKLKLLLILPVIMVVLYSFAKPEYRYITTKDHSIVLKTLENDQDPVSKPTAPQEAEKKVTKGKSETEAPLHPLPPSQPSLTIPPPPPLIQDTVKFRPTDGKQPLVVIDGKVTDIDLDLINPDAIESINVIKGIRVTDRYGEEGANGVIEITTKKKVSGITGSETEPKATNINEIEVIGYGRNTEKSSGIKIRSSSGGSDLKPLIVLDGEVYEKSVEEIDKDDIESISVLKDKSAVELYGGKGENGVIIITTKKKSEK